MTLKITKQFHKDYEVGKTYEVDAETAKNWIDAGLAEETNQNKDLLKDLENAFAEREQNLVKTLTESMKGKNRRPTIEVKGEDNRSLKDFLLNVATKNTDVLHNKYKAQKAMNEGTTTAGGFLVPTEFHPELLGVGGYSSIWRNARRLTINSKTTQVPCLDQTVTPSGGSSAFYAGYSVGIVSEATAPGSETKPAFKQLSLTLKKILAFTQISNELLADSPLSVAADLETNGRSAIDSYVDYLLLHGNGSTQPQGILGYAATKKVIREDAGQISLTDLGRMYAAMPASCRANAVWVITPQGIGQLIEMGSANGKITWVPNGQLSNALEMRIFGSPVVESEHAPALGSEGDVGYYDLSKYAVAVGNDIAVANSSDFAFTSDVQTVRLALRLDGRPQLTAPITLADGTTTVSPFVVLDDATS